MYQNDRLRSGCGMLSTNGPTRRQGSPPGGSILTTSAPRSARSLPAELALFVGEFQDPQAGEWAWGVGHRSISCW